MRRGRCIVNKATELPPPAERRPKSRRRVLLGGLVVYAEGAHSFGCTIRNLTDDGARITLPPKLAVPVDVYLISVRGRVAHEARIVWNNGVEAGLSFVKSFSINDVTDPKLDYLKKLWHGSSMR